jgi:hypothetical protein
MEDSCSDHNIIKFNIGQVYNYGTQYNYTGKRYITTEETTTDLITTCKKIWQRNLGQNARRILRV